MDNWLYYVVLVGFFVISQVMEKRRKQGKKDSRPVVPPPPNDARGSGKKPRRNRPKNLPDSLDEVLAEMLGIPRQAKPSKKQPTKTAKSSSTPAPVSQKRISTTPPESSAPISGSREKLKTQAKPAKEQETSTYGDYTKPKSVADERNMAGNQGGSTQKGPVNLRQAVIYQTILERKYS